MRPARGWLAAAGAALLAAVLSGCPRTETQRPTEQTTAASVVSKPKSDAPRPAHSAVGSLADVPAGWRPLFVDDSGFDPLPEPRAGDWLAEHPEPGQSFDQFVAAQPNRVEGKRGRIYLAPIGKFDAAQSPKLAVLRDYAERYFAMPVGLMPAVGIASLKVTERKNPHTGNRQLLSVEILDRLEDRVPGDAYCVLGVTMVDLYPQESWNFVFGQARLKRRVGVYSFARYDPAFYDEPTTPESAQLVLRRSLKVMVHEIGHMFGIEHCIHYSCLENGSNHLNESDASPLHLCPVCLRKLQYGVGFDPVQRYQRLGEFYGSHGFAAEAAWVEQRLQTVR